MSLCDWTGLVWSSKPRPAFIQDRDKSWGGYFLFTSKRTETEPIRSCCSVAESSQQKFQNKFQSSVLCLCPPPPTSPPCPPFPVLPQCIAGTGAWQRINTAVKLLSPRYPVFDLQDGQKYQFRVSSVNMYGCSEASEPSEPVQKVAGDGKGDTHPSHIRVIAPDHHHHHHHPSIHHHFPTSCRRP